MSQGQRRYTYENGKGSALLAFTRARSLGLPRTSERYVTSQIRKHPDFDDFPTSFSAWLRLSLAVAPIQFGME